MVYRRRTFNALAFKYTAGDSLAQLGGAFTRASSATELDAGSSLVTLGVNVARDGNYIGGLRTLLLEAPRTNSFLNSGAPATHTSPSLGAGTYTLWMVGTGSIAVAAGTATITGAGTATAGTPVTFTVTVAGTVTFTVTGTPTRAQCENGAFATSYIATAGAAVARSGDVDTFPFRFAPAPMTLYLNFLEQGTIALTSFQRLIQIGDSTATARALDIRVQSGKYGIAHEINGGAAVSSGAAAAPSIGNLVELRAVLNADGSVQLGQSINGAAEVVSAASAAFAMASAWAAPSFALNQAPGGGSAGFAAFRSAKIAFGVQNLATMQAA